MYTLFRGVSIYVCARHFPCSWVGTGTCFRSVGVYFIPLYTADFALQTESFPCPTASTIVIPHTTINHDALHQHTHVRYYISVPSHSPCLNVFSNVCSEHPSADSNRASVWQTICTRQHRYIERYDCISVVL